MAEENIIEAQAREGAGRGAARAVRRSGLVPAIVYGDKRPNANIAIAPQVLLRALHRPGFFTTLFDLKVNGTSERVLPRDVQFDARFFGGARQGMDKAFDVAFVTKTSSRAGGYTQEWRVPRAAVPDASPTDTTWRINVYRLERRRRGDVVVGTEASALSPPERNDFHALDRMVALTLAPR